MYDLREFRKRETSIGFDEMKNKEVTFLLLHFFIDVND